MEKIEKLEEFNWVSGRDAITIALCNTIIRKQNEIIDHLNSQDQEEENNFVYTVGTPILESTTTCSQDTPEEKEEWEFDLRNLMYRDGEQLRCAGEGKPYTGEYRELVVSMIKNLLSEREREVLNSMREWVVEYHKDNWDIRDFDAEIAIGKIIDRELSKLNNK